MDLFTSSGSARFAVALTILAAAAAAVLVQWLPPRDQGAAFEVVALSIDRGGLAAVKPFFDELDLRALRIYVDPSAEAPGRLDGLGIPLTLLVDRQGRERWRVLGPAPWDRADVIDFMRRGLAAQ